MESSQYVLGMMVAMDFCFMGKIKEMSKGWLVLNDAYVIGAKPNNPQSFVINSLEDLEDIEDEEENVVVETISQCNETFVISGDFYCMSITEEIYNSTRENEWAIPQTLIPPDTELSE